MSLLDKITQSLGKILPPPPEASLEDEQGHMALLEQSSGRIRETITAIKEGNLVAASSTTEDLRANHEMRYQDMVGGSRRNVGGFTQGLSPAAGNHTDRINATLPSSTVSR